MRRRYGQKTGTGGRMALILILGTAVFQAGPPWWASAENRSPVPIAPPPLMGPAAAAYERTPRGGDPEQVKPLLAGLMIVSMDCALKITPEDGSFLDRLPPGGVWIRPSGKPENLPLLVEMLRRAEQRAGRPMLIGSDPWDLTTFMSGAARKPLPPLPPLMAVSAAGGDQHAAAWAETAALTMRAMGLDWMPGPNLSLWPERPGSAASTRCIGSRPYEVARIGAAIMRGMQDRGVVTAAWGFPGGSWTRDRTQPPVLTTPPEAWSDQDGRPYLEACRIASMVHVGDTEVPLWSGGPAMLSSTIIQDLLRRQLGFRGIVLAGPADADTLMMDAAEAALQALLAGADMVLWQGGLRGVERAIDYLAAAATRGDLPVELLREKASRVAGILTAVRQKTMDGKSGGTRPEKTMATLQRAGLTLVHLRGNALPLDRDAAPVGLTGTVDLDALQKSLRKSLKSVAQQPILSAGHIGNIQTFEIDRLTRNMRGFNAVVVTVTERERVETVIELLCALRQQVPRVIVVFLGRPDYAVRLTDADAVLLAWGCAGSRDSLMRAVADVLTGRSTVGLADLPDLIRLRPGETRVLDGSMLLRVPAGRLPCRVGEDYPAGFFRSMPPQQSVRDLVWTVDGKKVRGPSLTLSADPVRPRTVSLEIRDVFGDTQTATFAVVSGDLGQGS